MPKPVTPLLTLLSRIELYKAFLELDRRARAIANKDEICQLLRKIPGVGYITSLTFKAAIDDPIRSMHVDADKTNQADHGKKRDPGDDKIKWMMEWSLTNAPE